MGNGGGEDTAEVSDHNNLPCCQRAQIIQGVEGVEGCGGKDKRGAGENTQTGEALGERASTHACCILYQRVGVQQPADALSDPWCLILPWPCRRCNYAALAQYNLAGEIPGATFSDTAYYRNLSLVAGRRDNSSAAFINVGYSCSGCERIERLSKRQKAY